MPTKEKTEYRPKKRPAVSVALRPDVAEAARNTAFAFPGLTMTDLVNVGVKMAIRKLEIEENNGEPFPMRTRAIKRGRPIKVPEFNGK